MDAAVCCRLLACSSVRWLRSALPLAICPDPVAMGSLLVRTCETIARSLSVMWVSDRSSRASSSRPLGEMETDRSPPATASARATASSSGRVMDRTSSTAIQTAPITVTKHAAADTDMVRR